MWKGANDNYIEVVETGRLLIPNAVTLIKAEQRTEGAANRGPIHEEDKIKDLFYWQHCILPTIPMN